ncbi:MAG: Gfo/Idh/MocA family oxidoreductase [Lachnospiraceae bacterium]|nr:Gfo/Idh/MocA family oxidoreductase [Lachnospiraceae bacterium]
MKICFVGIGSIAKRHIRNISEICKERGTELTIDALRRKDSRGLDLPDGIDRVYTDEEELPGDYDVIFITNPTEYHADTLVKLHDRSKHFFIEKPVATLDTIETLDKISFREDSVYYVACPLRYNDVIRYLKKEIDPERVISVRSISSSYLPDWRPGTDYRKSYSAHRDMGGGVGIDLIHEWDYLTWFFGFPDSVKSFTGKISGLEIDSDDHAIYIARYKNMIAELHLDYFGRQSIREVELFTDEDTIIGDIINGTVRYLKEGKTVSLQKERDAYQKRELEYFLDLIEGGKKPQNDVENAIKVLKLTQGIV